MTFVGGGFNGFDVMMDGGKTGKGPTTARTHTIQYNTIHLNVTIQSPPGWGGAESEDVVLWMASGIQ